MNVLGVPPSRYPTSWWQVAWSHDLAPGQVTSLKYFGQELVMWRGEDGEVSIQDAYCLHLGAHRGVRGKVIGNDLQCPWHGWQWNGAGENTLIPYSKEGCKPKLKIRSYPVQERYAIIWAWYSPDDCRPRWNLPEIPEVESGDYYPLFPASNVVHRIKAHCQSVLENTADPAHVMYVHGAGDMPRVSNFEIDGHILKATLEVPYGAGVQTTKLTPNGSIVEKVDIELHGLGVAVLRFRNVWPTVQFGSPTPVDDTYTDYYFQQASQRVPGDRGDEPSGVARMLLDLQQEVITQDFFTWENMKYLEAPSFAAEEAVNYCALRRWAWQFYPEAPLVDQG